MRTILTLENSPPRIARAAIYTGLITLLLIVLPAAHSPSAHETLTLAVHPYLTYNELIGRFTPLAEYLSTELGQPFDVRIGTDYMEHMVNVGEGRVDIAFLGPALYIALADSYGKHPLIVILETNGEPTFSGRIVVREDSPITRLSELQEKKIAFVDPHSTMGYLLPLHMLTQYMVKEDILRNSIFVHSHINVVLGVLTGDFDAGAVKEEVFSLYQDKGLRELVSTPDIPEHLFVARKGLSPEIISGLRKAFTDLNKSEQGRQIMHGIKKDITGMVPVKDSDFNELRTIIESMK